MKTKIVDKKGKKPSLNKTSSLTKSRHQQKNAVRTKKDLKKAKLVISVQNENPTLENKVQVFKVIDKQKWKQDKEAKQQNAIIGSSKIKIKDAKEKTSSTSAESKKDILSETKKLEYLKKRQRRRSSHNINRHKLSVASITRSVEEIKKKIEEIRSREVLSKTAKKKLGVLNRKLRVEESANKSNQLDTMVKKSNEKGKHIQTYQEDALVKRKQTNEDKMKAKKKHVQNKKNKVKLEEDKQNDNVTKDSDDEDESDEDQSDAEKKLMADVKEQIDDESEEDEEDTDNKASILEVRKNQVKNKKKQFASLDYQEKEEMKKEKKQYVLFVGNLPSSVTAGEVKKHFLTKAGIVTNVSIKKNANATHSFAYVMTTNHTDSEKGLLLHGTTFMKKKMHVRYLMPKKKADVIKRSTVAKNKKLQALQKAGKLVENQGNQGEKKPLKKKKQNSGQPKA